MASSPKFNFPNETLTPISGKPTNTTLQILQRPPPEPVGTAAVIGVALRNHAEALADLALYNNLNAALTAQILSAVNASFLSALEDPDFGFGDVSPRTMLEHLRTEYGTLTPEELEKNRAAQSEPWNFDDPIVDLWAKIVNIQRVAAFGAVPIADITIITLTLAMIEKTGLLATTTEKFRLRPVTEWTVALFKADFILGNKERIRRLPRRRPLLLLPSPPPQRPRPPLEM